MKYKLVRDCVRNKYFTIKYKGIFLNDDINKFSKLCHFDQLHGRNQLSILEEEFLIFR